MPRACSQSRARTTASRHALQRVGVEQRLVGVVLDPAIVCVVEPRRSRRLMTVADGERRSRNTGSRHTSGRASARNAKWSSNQSSSPGPVRPDRGERCVPAPETARARGSPPRRRRRPRPDRLAASGTLMTMRNAATRSDRGGVASEPEVDERVVGARGDLQDRRDQSTSISVALATMSTPYPRPRVGDRRRASVRARG